MIMPDWRSGESAILRLAVILAVLVVVKVFTLLFSSNLSGGLGRAASGVAWLVIGLSLLWLFKREQSHTSVVPVF